MPGIPVIITDKYGIPVRQVTSGAPLMTVAANGLGIPVVLSDRGAPFIVEGANPVAPSAFTIDMWSIAPTTAGIDAAINVTINSLPYDGGSEITLVEYRFNLGSWLSSGGVGSFTIPGLTVDTTYEVEIRAVNAVGNGPASDVKSATPINNDFWQSFDMTAGTSINWIGYNPADGTGSITREPNPAYPLIRLVFDPVVNEVMAAFTGDVEAALEGFSLFIGGFETPLTYVSTIPGESTTAHYMVEPGFFVDGMTYQIEFLAARPSWIVPPSISGTPQVGQTLTASYGTIVNGAPSGRRWKRDGVDIDGATFLTYLLVEADLGAMISFRLTATGPGGATTVITDALGPVTAEASGGTL